MNRALWIKAVLEGRRLGLSLALLLFVFQWLFVYLTSLIDLTALGFFLKTGIPAELEKLAGIPFALVATTHGRIAMAYVDPVILFAAVSWGVARGSDCVSGEIGRGTMEMLLAQPVRRLEILVSQATVTTLGAALLAVANWCGTAAGLATVPLDEPVLASQYIPGAINLFAMMFFVAGVSTLASSWDSYRWRTIGLVGAFYMIELVIKVFARMVDSLDWLMYATFLGAFEPQRLIVEADKATSLALKYNGTLLGLGLAAYVLAAVIFCRRDLPAPV